MRNDIADQGSAGTGFIDPSNNNFKELYQFPASKMQKFISKVRSYGVYKDEIIRVSICADSIWNTYQFAFEDYLRNTFPNKTFEFLHAQLGGTGSDYLISMMDGVIGFNPDLFVFAEWENYKQAEYSEKILSMVREKTTADIAMYPWYIGGSDMDLLVARNIDGVLGVGGWKRSEAYKLRQWFYAMAGKYNCEMIDYCVPIIDALYNGNATTAQLSADGIHPTALFFSDYVPAIQNNHFGELHNNYFLSNHKSEINTSKFYAQSITLPDINNFTKSGVWDLNVVDTDKSYNVLQSSSVAAYIESTINGIGFELACFGDAVGQFGILIDGVTPSTLIKDYAYFNGINSGSRPYKVILDSNILSNDEITRTLSVTMTSATQYTLTDVTNSTVIRTGALISQDEVFTITGGQITIPANYAGVSNFRDTISSGASWTILVKKNHYNTIDIAADSLTTVTRIFGLERGEHTIRLTVNSGTVNLDSIMELK